MPIETTHLQTDTPPAISILLTGQHLIEASAGTGKTWTLTGIVLRLLVEARRPPEQIICTTFTRAAAAEMRERIQSRLQEFYQLLLWLEQLLAKKENHSWLLYSHANNPAELEKNTDEPPITEGSKKKAYKNFINHREITLINAATHTSINDFIEDPVNLHLLHYLLDRVHRFSINASVRRIQMLLVSLDKLFVGTLDSLAQKWLSEYSAETGYQQGMTISDNEPEIITDIIHDQVRQFQSQVNQQSPELYKLLAQSGHLTQVSDHLDSVKQANQFITVPIDDISSASFATSFNFAKFSKLIKQFIDIDYSDIHNYFSADYRKEQGMTARGILNTSFDLLPNIFLAVQKYGTAFYFHLDAQTSKLFDAISFVYLHKDDGGKGFNKTKENNRQTFIALPTMQLLEQLINMTTSLLDYMDGLLQRLNRNIALQVREQLPLILEEKNKTSFSLQMVRLNHALQGKQGKHLATHIRHHYPVALIDESQDVNGEQAKMLQSIYMNMDTNNQSNEHQRKSFLLLVGDPKQAIYGFRGGDVANYNAMKKRFKNIMTLGMNRRSNATLINSLNQWFDSSNPIYSELGQDIHYHHIQAHRQESRLSWQEALNHQSTLFGENAVAIIHHAPETEADEDITYDKFSVLATHIQQLLHSDEYIDKRPISAQDIAVLVRSKSDMHKAGQAIERLGIATLKTIENSVFSSKMAEDLLAVMLAVQNPFHINLVNRALTTHWYGLTLTQVKSLQVANTLDPTQINKTQIISYHDFQQYLHTAQEKWHDYGLLSAIQYLLSRSPFLQYGNSSKKSSNKSSAANSLTSIWQQLAEHKQGQRHLLDLRHLLEILSTKTQGMSEQQVLDWFNEQRKLKPNDDWAKQRPIPTDSGIQLMTIHKSKGLEFPIAYVLGMDSSAKKISRAKFTFYPYIKDQQRRLAPVKTMGKIDYQAEVDQANLGEEKRIAYVALTRASEQIYILLSDHKKKVDLNYRPANIWLDSTDKVYQLSSRLTGYVDWIKSANIIDKLKTEQSTEIAQHKIQGDDIVTPQLITYPNYDKVITKKYFVGWNKTSFTALSRQLDKHSAEAFASEPDYTFEDDSEQDVLKTIELDNEYIDTNIEAEMGISEDNIRFNFVRGAGAGTFLHEVLEKMDFNQPHSWSQQIDRSLIKSGLPLVYASEHVKNSITGIDNQHEQLKQWLSDVLHSSMLASNKRLIDIPLRQRKPEMGFDMGLSANFRAEQINDLFSKHLDVQGVDKDKLITLMPKSGSHFYRYLRGEIDLVYEHAGKFYVVDYKSNHLGEHINDYNTINLSRAMGKAGYWLQALIYQVALHRFLGLRITNYHGNEHKYLGAVEYLFLRGCVADADEGSLQNSTDTKSVTEYGKITWEIPIQLVKDMDELLGRP